MNFKNYRCLSKVSYDFDHYELVPIRIQDSEPIRQWRNEQIKFLRQDIPISPSEQKSYFETVIKPTFDKIKPELILFSFLENSKLIGYGGFVNIDWGKKISEISFLIETNRAEQSIYENDFTVFLKLIKNIACNELKFNELFTETYNIRPTHIKILEKNDFQLKNKINGGKIIDEKPVDVLFHSYICGN